jgi:hypothetical protein
MLETFLVQASAAMSLIGFVAISIVVLYIMEQLFIGRI